MLIRDCMTRDPVTVKPGDTLAAAKAKMEAGDFRRIPVLDGGKLVGILSEYDLKNYMRVLDSTMVHTAMT